MSPLLYFEAIKLAFVILGPKGPPNISLNL